MLQVKSLDGTPYAWLGEILLCFSDGDMPRFDSLCSKYAAQMNSQPALVATQRGLKQKITIMCLVALVSACVPPVNCAAVVYHSHKSLICQGCHLGLPCSVDRKKCNNQAVH